MTLIVFADIRLAGVTQGDAQEVIKQIVLEAGVSDFSLIREPKNPYDPYAVRIDCCTMYVGYVPKELSKMVAEAMDSGRNLAGKLRKVNMSPAHNTTGLTIDIVEV